MPLTKGSQPMKPVRGCAARLRDQMLAAAEADLETHLVDRTGEQRAQIGRRRRREIEREPRQQRFEQRRLLRTQRMALAAAEKARRGGALVLPHPSR